MHEEEYSQTSERTIPQSKRQTWDNILMELIRDGARKIIAQALEAEVTEFVATFAEQKDTNGHALVVRNRYLPLRDIPSGIGPMPLRVPKVRRRNGKPVTFHSALIRPYKQKVMNFESAIPIL